jgi:hypothetical protein
VHEAPSAEVPSWEPSIVVDVAEQQALLDQEEQALLDEELALEEQARAAAASASPATVQPPVTPTPVLVRRASVGELPPVEVVPSVTMPPGEMTTFPSSDAVPGAKTPPPGTPLPVLLLVEQAREASGEERQQLARRINRLLDQMVLEGGSRHVADWFHHLIESGQLEGLEDGAGHACHETAIKGLLAMGFPYALEVRPEDLQRLQPKEQEAPGRNAFLTPLAATVAGGGAIAQMALHLLGRSRFSPLLTLEVGVSLLALTAVLVGKPRTPLRQMGKAVMMVASILSVFLGMLPGYAGLVSGLAGLVAALLFAIHES